MMRLLTFWNDLLGAVSAPAAAMQWPLFERACSCPQSPILGMDGHMDGCMQPRVAFLKLDEDCFSSDSEERLTLKVPSIDHRSLLTDGVAPAPRTSRLPDREDVCNSRHPVALVFFFPTHAGTTFLLRLHDWHMHCLPHLFITWHHICYLLLFCSLSKRLEVQC